MNYSQKLKTFIEMFEPSAVGMTLYCIVAVLGIIFHNILAYGSYNSLVEAVKSWSSAFQTLNDNLIKIINSSRTDFLVIYLFWGFIGLIVYVFLKIFISNFSELVEDLSIRNYVWPTGTDKNKPLLIFLEKFVYRIVLISLVLVYVIHIGGYFLSTKFSISIVYRSGESYHDFIRPVALFALEILALHVLVIALRFLFLKKRLLSSD